MAVRPARASIVAETVGTDRGRGLVRLGSLVRQMKTNVLALVVVDMDGDLLHEMEGFAVGGFEVLQIGPENVVGVAGWQALLEFAVVVGIDFPSRLVRLVFATPDLHRNSIHRSVIGTPHRPHDDGVRFAFGFLSIEQATRGTEVRQEREHEEGDNPEP